MESVYLQTEVHVIYTVFFFCTQACCLLMVYHTTVIKLIYSLSKLAFECHTLVKCRLSYIIPWVPIIYVTWSSTKLYVNIIFSGWMHTYFRILGFETCSVYWKATCRISIWKLPYLCPQKIKWTSSMYNISHEICTQFLCAWFYCDCIIRFCWIYVIYFLKCFKCDTPALGQSVMIFKFLVATKQLYKWYFPSVRLSVCLSHLFD